MFFLNMKSNHLLYRVERKSGRTHGTALAAIASYRSFQGSGSAGGAKLREFRAWTFWTGCFYGYDASALARDYGLI